jgi:acylphosphatase
VFFRAEAAQRARALGLGGFVRNTPDGRVEAAFEGDPEAVAAMVNWMHAGPPLARVDDVEVIEEDPRGDAEFRISH